MAQTESGYTGQYQPRNDMESLQLGRLNGICTPYPPNPDDVLKFVLDLANDAQHFLNKRHHQDSVSCSIVALLAADIWPYFRPLSELRSTFVETIWGASQMVKCEDNGTKKALFYLVDGMCRILHGEDNSQLIQFLSEICTLIPHAPAGDPDLQRLLCEGLELTDHKITYTEVWVKIIKTLADQSNWKSVAMLLLGYKTGISSSLERMDSSNWSCESISVSAMLKDLSGYEIQDYGESLAIAMLEKGANVDEIGDMNDCPTLHFAVKLAIQHGTIRLLSCILKMYENSPQKRDATNRDGSTALHILVRSGFTSRFRYANEILDMLLKSGCDALIVDNANKKPIDYAGSKYVFYQKLLRSSLKPVCELRRDRDQFKVNSIAMVDAFDSCLNGYKYTNQPTDIRYELLIDACALLIDIPESRLVKCYSQLSALEKTNWSQVLSSLCKNGEWKAVAYLIFGSSLYSPKLRNEITVEILDLQWHAVATNCSTDDVQTNTIMDYLKQCDPVKEAHWLDAVLCSVIHHGNLQTWNNLAVDENDCALHAATRFCLQTKRVSILKHFVNADRFFDNGGRNKAGDTVFYCLTKLLPRPDAEIVQKVTDILINKGMCIRGRNSDGSFGPGWLDKQLPDNVASHFSDLQFIKELHNASRTQLQCGNSKEVIYLCSEVIDNLEYCDSHGGFDNHDVAMLYCFRAEAYLTQKMYDLALRDTTQSIYYDERTYKANLIAANCLKAMGKVKEAVDAFSKAYHTVEYHTEDKLKVEILSEIATLSCRLPNSYKRIDNLPPKQDIIWLKSCYELVLSGDCVSANMAYQQFKLDECKSIRLDYSLKPLCHAIKQNGISWAIDAMVDLLELGCDKKTIQYTKNDEYIHVVVKMSLLAKNLNLLKYVVRKYNDWNVVDRKKRNSPLHVLCKEENVDVETRSEMIKLLLQCGVKPGLKNHDQKLASDCLSSDEKENADIIHEAVLQKGKTGNIKQSKSNKSRQEVKPKKDCDELYKIGVNELERGNMKKGYGTLVQVFKQEHKGEKHESIVKKTMSAIVKNLSASTHPEIPDSLTSLELEHFQIIVNELSAADKWCQLDMLVRKCRTNRLRLGHLALRMKHNLNSTSDDVETYSGFASKMTVIPVIEFKEAKEDDKLQILQTILSGGARLGDDNGNEALERAIDKGYYKILVELVKSGADTKRLSMYQGDTPIHAAVTIVLEKTKSSDLVKYLIDLYYKDMNAYSHLDPEQLDVNGDCIFHLIARANYANHVLKLIKIMCDKRGISAKYRNKNNQLPLSIVKRNDKRWQYIRKAQDVQPATEQSFEGTVDMKIEAIVERGVDVVKCSNFAVVKKLSEKEERLERIKQMVKLFPKNQHSVLDETIGEVIYSRTVSTNDNEIDLVTKVPSDNLENVPNLADIGNDEFSNDVAEPGKDQFENAYTIDAQVFDNLEWEVECTSDVWKILRNKHISTQRKCRIIKKIQMLASGDWHSHLCKKLKQKQASLKLFETEISKGMRIIWELAIDFSPRCTESIERYTKGNLERNHEVIHGRRIYSEIIRVWDIVFKQDDVHSSVQRIIKSHQRGATCLLRKSLRGMKVEADQTTFSHTKRYPVLYAEDDVSKLDLKHYKQEMQSLYPPGSPNETEYHILKFYSFSTTLVSYVLQNIETDVDLPFRVSELEHDIINLISKAPILLLGRSGTGKTTCCLYRLWSKFKAYWTTAKQTEPLFPRVSEFVHQEVEHVCGNNASENSRGEIDDTNNDCYSHSTVTRGRCCDTPVTHAETVTEIIYDHLHQLFVTKNVVLSKEVQKNFRELCNADDVMHEHCQQEQNKLPNRLQDLQENAFPLFVSSRQLIIMLDASIGPPYFFDRKHDGSLNVDVTGWSDLDGPLHFLQTFDGDSDVEADAEQYTDNWFVDGESPVATASFGTKRKVHKVDLRREITYVVFANEVWPKIKKKASCHPSLVWTEIMSFIKGSHEALCEPRGCLDIGNYIEVGEKRAPNFRDSRYSIYEIFERYETFKTQNNLFDEIDLVHNVFNRLIKIKTPYWVFHQVFVDETQDFTQAELALLMRLCQNPNEMFLTGDTAQSIMKGISFRFSDLRTLFFNARETMRKLGKMSAVEVPKQEHQLKYNYRSHNGILSLSNSILDLITRFFPDSYDRLQPDQGMFPGPQPLLFESCSFADLAVLLRGNRRTTSRIEFGAHQAILVANDTARDNIPEELTSGLILTIYEAKGLEFDDILLYNFFKDSQATEEWRVVTSYLDQLVDELEESDHTNDSLVVIDRDILSAKNRARPLTFDDRQHKVLNSELKLLYTALTRARVNVWIFDEDEKQRKPMFEYFKARKLVKSMHIEDITESNSQESIFAASSDPSDWMKRGKEFMRRRVYNVAAKCFLMGGYVDKEQESLAYHKALTAFNMSNENHKKKCEELLSAAELLLNCDKPSKAALCLRRAKENKLAADLYKRLGQYEEAADIYRKMKLPIETSECYEELGKYNQGIGELSKSGKYELAVDMLKRYQEIRRTRPQELLDDDPVQFAEDDLYYEGALFCHKNKDKRRMLEAVDRFDSKEKKLEFLEEMNYIVEAALIHEDNGELEVAARLLCMHGCSTEAVDMALKTENDELIVNVLLAASRKLISESKTKKQPLSNCDILKAKLKPYITGEHTYQCTDKYGQIALVLAEFDQDMESIMQAWTAFDTSGGFAYNAGLVECCDLLAELIHMESCEMSDMRLMFKGVKSMFHVCQTLQDDLAGIYKLTKYYKFYGFELSSNFDLVFYPKKYPIYIKMLRKVETNDPKVVIDQNTARACIVGYLLKKGKTWINKIRTGLTSIRKRNLDCLDGVAGVKNSGKSVQDIFQTSIEIDLFRLDFEKKIYYAITSLREKCTGETKSIVCGFVARHEDPCHKVCLQLWNDLLTSAGYPAFLDDIFCREFLCQLRKKNNVVHFKHFLAERWQIFISGSQPCINIMEEILFFQFGNYLFGIEHVQGILHSSLAERIDDFKNGLDKNNQRSLNKNRLDDTRAAYSFVEAFHYLTATDQQPLKSVLKFCMFQIQVGEINGSRPRTYPDLKHYLMWIEFFTSLSFLMIAKLKSEECAGFVFFLPNSYVSLIHFIQATFPESTYTVEKTVAKWSSYSNKHTPSEKKPLKERLRDYAFVISGYAQSEKIIAKCSQQKNDIALLERFVILGLVMICNFGEAGGEDTVSRILSTFITIQPSEGVSERLTDALQSIKKCTVVSDIAYILDELLRERNKAEKLTVCRWYQGKMCTEVIKLADYTFSDAFSFDKLPAVHDISDPLIIDIIKEELGIHAMFEHIRIDDQMCSFCGYHLSEGLARVTDGELTEGPCEDRLLQGIRNEHSEDSRHIQNVEKFNIFKDKCRDQFMPNLYRVKEMLSNSYYQLSDANVVRKRYGEEGIDIERLNNICQKVEKNLNHLLSIRVWNQLMALGFEHDMTQLMEIFQNVETLVKYPHGHESGGRRHTTHTT